MIYLLSLYQLCFHCKIRLPVKSALPTEYFGANTLLALVCLRRDEEDPRISKCFITRYLYDRTVELREFFCICLVFRVFEHLGRGVGAGSSTRSRVAESVDPNPGKGRASWRVQPLSFLRKIRVIHTSSICSGQTEIRP